MAWREQLFWFLLLCVGVLPACEGSGSDIGPTLRAPIPANYRVLVQDDQYRAVTSALVSIDGITETAATNRYGRASILAVPSGVRRMHVDGTNASAVAGSRLAALSLTASMPDRNELPYVVYLPDTSQSATSTLLVGTNPVTTTLDDSANSGAIVTVPGGTSVGLLLASTVVLRAGKLARGHLPGELPAPSSGARLWDTGVYIDPAGVTFAPGAALSMPNSGLNLPVGASADLYRLDDFTGVWERVGSGVVNGVTDRIEAPAGSVTTGGLYAFATTVSQTTTLTGIVVNQTGRRVHDALVRAVGQRTRTFGDGSFVLSSVPSVDGGGAPLTVTLDVHGGRDWRATSAAVNVTVQPGSQPVSDVLLETNQVSDVRLQLIKRGAVDPHRRLRLALSMGSDVGIGVGDSQGRIDYDDIETGGYIGVLTSQTGRPGRALVAEAFRFFGDGSRRLDLQVFAQDQEFLLHRSSQGTTAVHVVDAVGTGPVQGAALVNGSTPGIGYLGQTVQNGILFGEFGYGGEATASITTTAGGLTVTSACTLSHVDSARIEIPLLRAVARANGGYDRHGLVAGQLLQASTPVPKTRLLRSTRYFILNDWYEEVFDGEDVLGNVPFVQDPATSDQFKVGVTEPVGHLAAVEGTTVGVSLELERMGIAANLQPVPGGVIRRDVALDLVADTQFDAPGAIKNLDPGTSSSALTFDLAAQLADSTIVDVGRGFGGASIFTTGEDAEFRLPALGGQLAGGRYYVALHGAHSSGGKSVKQSTLIPLDGTAGPRVELLGVPDITSPSPNATVSGDGFTVNFSLPKGALYAVIRLQSSTAGELRDWTAILPNGLSSFSFRQLPPEAAQPLVAGRTWTLSVTAVRVEAGALASRILDEDYRKLLQHYVGLIPAERQSNAYSSTSIQVTTN